MKQDNPRSGATLSKPEAVWKAIEALGARADVTEILEYVRTKFGITADSDSTSVVEAPVAASPMAVATPPAPAPAAPQPAAVKQAEPAPSEPARKPASQKKPRPRNDSAD